MLKIFIFLTTKVDFSSLAVGSCLSLFLSKERVESLKKPMKVTMDTVDTSALEEK